MSRIRESVRPTTEERSGITGSSAAALVASGIGCATLGLMTTLSEASASLSKTLNLYSPVGPLSGKTTVAVVVWLIAWMVLHFAWRGKSKQFGSVFTATIVLIVLGLLGTFPIFFDLFAP